MKLKLTALAAAAVMMFGVREASAVLNITATANPFFGGGYSLTSSTSGTVQYVFSNLSSSTDPLGFLNLRFQKSAFDFSSFPAGFAFNAMIGATDVSSSFVWHHYADHKRLTAASLSTLVMSGQNLVLTMGFELMGPATTVSWATENQLGLGAWQQPLGYGVTTANPFFVNTSLALTPEPGTLILLGSGLLGSGLVRRYRQRRNTKA